MAQFTESSGTIYRPLSYTLWSCQSPCTEMSVTVYRVVRHHLSSYQAHNTKFFRHNIESQAPSTFVSAHWIPKLETSHISTDIGGARFRGIRNPSLRSTRRGGQEIRSLPGEHSGYRGDFHYPLLQGCSRSATSKANLHTTCSARSLALAIPRYVLPSRHVTIEM